jgi:Protein of unknown function (DUF2778)
LNVWIYEQKTGWLLYSAREGSSELVSRGYSGSGEGKNDPAMESHPSLGPIPIGTYHIVLQPFESPAHGPCCLRLVPASTNEMFGRSGFLIHGDSIVKPGMASRGCIILPRNIRDRIIASRDPVLRVVHAQGEEEKIPPNKTA